MAHLPLSITPFPFSIQIIYHLFLDLCFLQHQTIIMGFCSCSAESTISTCAPYISTPVKSTSIPTIRNFTFTQLDAATDSFSPLYFLGRGSHGTVYRANLDDGNLIAAVKKTTVNDYRNGSRNYTATKSTTPAENEIEILSILHYRYLVNLIGFCSETSKKLIVVEFMPNGSLYDLLHSNAFNLPGWKRRICLALCVAKAVRFLHSSEPPVIHRDIKSSNVLIDSDGNARLGDFGLALRGCVDDVRVRSAPPAGTLGYLDPGYLVPADLSTKTDIYSFGILLLEIISGRNAIDMNYSPPSLVDWAVPLIKHGEFDSVCDSRLGCPADVSLIRQMAILAAQCVRPQAGKRPAMREVTERLQMIYERSRSVMWNAVGRRVTPLIRSCGRLKDTAASNDQEITKLSSKVGHRWNKSKKVSNVGSTEFNSSNRIGRSKSIGSLKSDFGKNEVKMSKSRSVGVLRSSNSSVKGFGKRSIPLTTTAASSSTSSNKVVRSKEKGIIFIVKNPHFEEEEEEESDQCKLLVCLDKFSNIQIY